MACICFGNYILHSYFFLSLLFKILMSGNVAVISLQSFYQFFLAIVNFATGNTKINQVQNR